MGESQTEQRDALGLECRAEGLKLNVWVMKAIKASTAKQTDKNLDLKKIHVTPWPHGLEPGEIESWSKPFRGFYSGRRAKCHVGVQPRPTYKKQLVPLW